MTHQPSISDAHHQVDQIAIRPLAGTWRISVNDAFYGDYVRRYWAIEAAFEKAEDIAAHGGAAIITLPMDGDEQAVLFDTRRSDYVHSAAATREKPRFWPFARGRRSSAPDE